MLLEEGVCYDECVLLAKLLAFALIHFVLQGQIYLLLEVSLEFLLWHSRTSFLGVSCRYLILKKTKKVACILKMFLI